MHQHLSALLLANLLRRVHHSVDEEIVRRVWIGGSKFVQSSLVDRIGVGWKLPEGAALAGHCTELYGC